MKQIYLFTTCLFLFINLSNAQTNNALNFDGVDDYGSVPHQSAFDFTNGTIECWVKPNNYNYNKTLFSMRDVPYTSNTRWSLHLNSSTGRIGIYNGIGWYSYVENFSIANYSWYHIAFVMSTTSTKIYINGTLKHTINEGINNSITGKNLEIGRADANFTDEYFNGSIDDIRLWNYQLSESEINASLNCELDGDETGLIAYYKLNQGTANSNNSGVNTLNDISTNNYDGTLQNFSLNGTTSNWVDGSSSVSGDCSTLGVESVKINKKRYTLLKNPSNDFLQISGLTTRKKYSIFNLLGKVVLSGSVSENEKIEIKNFSNGLYILKLENGDELKFIKD